MASLSSLRVLHLIPPTISGYQGGNSKECRWLTERRRAAVRRSIFTPISVISYRVPAITFACINLIIEGLIQHTMYGSSLFHLVNACFNNPFRWVDDRRRLFCGSRHQLDARVRKSIGAFYEVVIAPMELSLKTLYPPCVLQLVTVRCTQGCLP